MSKATINMLKCSFCKSNINGNIYNKENCPVCNTTLAKKEKRKNISNLKESIDILLKKLNEEYSDCLVKPQINKGIIIKNLSEYCNISITRVNHLIYKIEEKTMVNGTTFYRIQDFFNKYDIEIKE